MRLDGAKMTYKQQRQKFVSQYTHRFIFNIPIRETSNNDSHSTDCRSLIDTLLAKSWTDHSERSDEGTSWELPVAHSKVSNHILTALQSLGYWKSAHSNYWTINVNAIMNCGSRNCQILSSHNCLKITFHIGNQIFFFSIMKTVLLSYRIFQPMNQ